MTVMSTPPAQPFYHGTKADLKEGDLIGPGFASNFGEARRAEWRDLLSTISGFSLNEGLSASRSGRDDGIPHMR